MEYRQLATTFDAIADTTSTIEKTDLLAEVFLAASEEELPMVIGLVQGRIFAPWESTELGVSTELTKDAIARATGVSQDQLEAWWRESGDLGDAAAQAVAQRSQQTLDTTRLDVETVHSALTELSTYDGAGSQDRRVATVAGLVSSARPDEAKYLVRTILGTMRLGVGEGAVRDAIAAAFFDGSSEASTAVERGYEVTNDFRVVAETAASGGRAALAELEVALFRPIKPMLAHQADSLGTALDSFDEDGGRPLLEVKYDGMRAKIHKDGSDIRVFTRRLEDVTTQFPDVVAAIADNVAADTCIIEAEIVAYHPDSGAVRPFQELSRRIKRKYDIQELTAAIPVTVYAFDQLYSEGDPLLETPLAVRLSRLEKTIESAPPDLERAANLRPTTRGAAEAFYEDALAGGHEGIMVKNLDARYQPGARVGYMLKVKPTMDPLDLVVPRAKWSEGRKSDFLGRPYLACRNQETGDFLEVGRMHSGFTDAELETLTRKLEPLIQEVDGREVRLDPSVVLEVEYEEIQESPTYDSGYALRFPRFTRFRDDLEPTDCDTLDRVEALYAAQDGG